MGYEALLYLIKPFLIALLFSCLASKASELSSALLLPTKFAPSSKQGTTQPLYCKKPFKQVFHRHCSHCHPHPQGQGRAVTPQSCTPTLSKGQCPNHQGCSGNSSRWAGQQLTRNDQPVLTSFSPGAAAGSPHSLLRPGAETLLAPHSLQFCLGKTQQTPFPQPGGPCEGGAAAQLIFSACPAHCL